MKFFEGGNDMQFILILVLFDSMMFGYAPKPRLRRVPTAVVQASRVQPIEQPPTPPSCVDSGNGETACNPIDDSGKSYR